MIKSWQSTITENKGQLFIEWDLIAVNRSDDYDINNNWDIESTAAMQRNALDQSQISLMNHVGT